MKQAHQVWTTLSAGAGSLVMVYLTNTMKVFLVRRTLAAVVRYLALGIILVASIYVWKHWAMFKPYLDVTRFHLQSPHD